MFAAIEEENMGGKLNSTRWCKKRFLFEKTQVPSKCKVRMDIFGV